MENIGEIGDVVELGFFDEVVRLCAGIWSVLLTDISKCLRGFVDLHIQLVVANERYSLAVGIECIFAKHRSRVKTIIVSTERV